MKVVNNTQKTRSFMSINYSIKSGYISIVNLNIAWTAYDNSNLNNKAF